jgi:uncharacterized protein YrrD
MLRNIKELEGCAIGATDGAIGHVKDFYFDDDAWAIRYLVVETGGWPASRKVLISPIAIGKPDWVQRLLPVAISKEQVRKSPDIDTDKPVSRQHETDYTTYYGYPYYWGGGGLWGEGMYPNMLLPGCEGFGSSSASRAESEYAYAKREEARRRDDDPHLRSCNAVAGYHIHATDGEIGHVESLLVDDQTWAILYLIVNTSNWWVGHKVLISPAWVQDVNWFDSMVSIKVTRQAVKDAPAYDPGEPLDRQHEMRLYKHYGRPGYWADAEILETDIARI